jgi:hypothetical protein
VIAHYDGQARTLVAAPSITESLAQITGSAPDDAWAISSFGSLFHYDGAVWTPVHAQGLELGTGASIAIWGVPRHLFVTGAGVSELDRARPWTCRTHETGCGDGVDDDCDGLIDGDDPDCATAIRLSQVAAGDEPIIEVVNHAATTANLSGMQVHFHLACDQFARSYAFPADALVPTDGAFRAVLGLDLGERERELDTTYCKTGATVDGWFALCSGACDLVTCSNVIDYVELGQPPSPLACASFAPGPVATSFAVQGEGATRTAFAGDRHGLASEWTIAPVTRH